MINLSEVYATSDFIFARRWQWRLYRSPPCWQIDREVNASGWLEFNVPFQHEYGYIRDELKQVLRTSISSTNATNRRLLYGTLIEELERCNPRPHVASRHMSISQLLSSCCYLFTVLNSGLLFYTKRVSITPTTPSQPRPLPSATPSPTHCCHWHIPELICEINSRTDSPNRHFWVSLTGLRVTGDVYRSGVTFSDLAKPSVY